MIIITAVYITSPWLIKKIFLKLSHYLNTSFLSAPFLHLPVFHIFSHFFISLFSLNGSFLLPPSLIFLSSSHSSLLFIFFYFPLISPHPTITFSHSLLSFSLLLLLLEAGSWITWSLPRAEPQASVLWISCFFKIKTASPIDWWSLL